MSAAASSNPFKPFFGAKWVIQSAFVTSCQSGCASVCVTNVSITDEAGPNLALLKIQLLASTASRSGRSADPGPYLVILSVTSSSGPSVTAQGTFPGFLGGPDEYIMLAMDSVNYSFTLYVQVSGISGNCPFTGILVSMPSASLIVSPAVSLLAVMLFMVLLVTF